MERLELGIQHKSFIAPPAPAGENSPRSRVVSDGNRR